MLTGSERITNLRDFVLFFSQCFVYRLPTEVREAFTNSMEF